jgi:hypothetical protein
MEQPKEDTAREPTILDEEDLIHEELDKELQSLSLQEEWAGPPSNSLTSDAKPIEEHGTKELTAKQKEKLEKKAKYKKLTKSKSAGQVCFTSHPTYEVRDIIS